MGSADGATRSPPDRRVLAAVGHVLAGLSILAAGLYSGAAWYVTAVELAALRRLPTQTSRVYWALSVKRTPRYATAALAASATALAAGHLSLRSAWTWGALTIFAVLPLTLVAILPVQRRLLTDSQADWSADLPKWARLHAVRTMLGLAATVAFLWAALS